MMAVQFRVEGDPVAKARPRMNRKTGQVYTPAKTRHYETVIALKAKEAMRDKTVLMGAVFLLAIIEIIPPKKRKGPVSSFPITRPDWDNFGKVISDACNGIVYKDDAQIAVATVMKRYSDQPGIAVFITPLGNSE